MMCNSALRDILRYFNGKKVDFSACEPDLSGLTEFLKKVLTVWRDDLRTEGRVQTQAA